MTSEKCKTILDRKKNRKITALVFFLLYFSNDTLLFGTNANRVFFGLHIAVLIFVFLWLFLDRSFQTGNSRGSISIPHNMGIALMALCVMTILTMIINMDMSIKYGYQIFMFLFSLLVVIRIDIKSFIEGYNRVVFFLATASIVAVVVSSVLPSIVGYLPKVINSVGQVYGFYGFGFLPEVISSAITRNYGIFREPGVYAIFLLLAVIFELFVIETNSLKRIMVYVVAMFLTFSTMSFLAIPLVLAVYFLKISTSSNSSVKHPSILKFLAILMVLIFIVGLTGNFEKIFGLVFNKLFTENSSRDSRTSAIFTNIDMMMRNPICGNGFSFVEDNFRTYSLKYTSYGGHNTNTLLKVLSVYGIPYCLLLIYSLYRFFRQHSGGFIAFALLVVLAVILSNEDLIVNVMLYVFAFYGLKPHKKANGTNSLVRDA